MKTTTYKTMDVSDLGDNCDNTDLVRFVQACQARQEETWESDEVVTEWMWGNGDWRDSTNRYAPRG